ncbi:unnamed protein product [Adineta ricciae]|uniref:F-box domain-containing protein n=1 Tax=Adineta ricciae TaxID=249248 RepID=A0A816FH10_ADIRI|nr:unnamed protein product [Adineta ricciae]
MSTMNINLVDLPTELFHSILDRLDAMTIIYTLRPVCKRTYSMIKSYNRFQLIFSSFYWSDQLLITQKIPFENVSSIVFSDSDIFTDFGIYPFFENFDIRRFSRLKSLSFKVSERSSELRSQAFQSNILINKIIQPVHSTLQYLKLPKCNYFQYHLILRTLPNLKTFIIDSFQLENANETINSVQKYEQLTSLTISKCNLLMEHFRLVLITVPSLTYLKLMSTRLMYGHVFNGSFWEEFIQIRFPQLKTFEFHFTYPIQDNAIVHSVNSIIASFRTSFWLQDKRWFTICDHFIKSKQIAVYTKSICVNQDGPLIRCEAVPVSSVCRLIENPNDIEHKTPMTLNFSKCHIDEQVIQDLADALSDDITIKTLDLQDSRFKTDMLQKFTDLLSKCTQLTTLHLGNNQLGPLGVQHFATLLQSNLVNMIEFTLKISYLRFFLFRQSRQFMFHSTASEMTEYDT